MATAAQQLGDLRVQTARIEGKIDDFLEQIKTQGNRSEGLEVRMRKLENRQHWYSGAAAGIGGIVGAFVEFMGAHH